MTILQCQNLKKCGEEFDERDADSYEERTPTEAWGVRKTVVEDFICCPFCGCKDLEEVAPDDKEEDALADMALEQAEEEGRREKSEFSKFLIDLVTDPWRRTG